MIRKINGTEQTRALISNIVTDLHSKRPLTSHVDYDISAGRNSSLLTDENGDKFRNVSIIYLKGIQAAIGNKTGNIIIDHKPRFLSVEKTIEKITDFLTSIQPKKMSESKLVKETFEVSNDVGNLGIVPDFSKSVKTLDSNGTKIEEIITGSNHTWSGECIEELKTL